MYQKETILREQLESRKKKESSLAKDLVNLKQDFEKRRAEQDKVLVGI